MQTTYVEEREYKNLKKDIIQNISQNKKCYMIQGVAFIILGVLAMVLPSVTAIGLGLLIGCLLVASGIIQLFASVKSKSHWWNLVSAILSIGVGALMFFNPVSASIALATILAIFLLLEGIIELCMSALVRSVKNWGWFLASGIISILLSALIFAGWPGASIVFLGIIVGINFLLFGVSMIAITKAVDQDIDNQQL